MKKLYLVFLISAALGKTFQAKAQAGSVVLVPTVGAQTSYASLTSAYAAIPASPTASYTIELQASYTGADASEVYPIQLTDKGITPGGAVTITIRPAAGNNGKIIQRPTAAAGPVLQFNGGDNIILDGRPGGITSTATNYLSVNDAFVGSNTNRNIEILNAASSNTIQYINCTAAAATAAGAGNRVILVGATTTTGNLNNTIQNCVVTGGLRGIQDFGQSDAIPNSGTKILGNLISNFGAIGIFAGTGQSNITINTNTLSMASYNAPVAGTIVAIQQQSLVAGTTSITNNIISLVSTSTATTGLTGIVDIAVGTENIQGNVIGNLTAPAATSVVGIGTYSNGVTTFNVLNNSISNLTGAAATSIIGANLGSSTTPGITAFNYTGNKINSLSSTTAAVNVRGMSIFPPAGSTLNLVNNFVALPDANTTATAIFGVLLGNTAGSNYTANVYYNSVRIGGTSTATTLNGYGIFKSDANAGSVLNLKNNIAYVDRNFSAGFYLSNTTGTLAIDYNNYYGAGAASSSYAASTSTTNYDNTQLATYKAAVAPLDANTTFTTVNFLSTTDLHLTGTSVTDANLKGTPITGITTDIDGQTRPATLPTKGADENGVVAPVDLLSFTGLSKGSYNQLNWATASESNNAGFELQRSADGKNFAALSFIKSKALNGNSTDQLAYSFNDLKPFVASGFYRLKQVDKDGNSKYSPIVKIKGKEAIDLQIANLYPNPVISQFSLIVSSKNTSSIAISITDASGRLVMQKTVGISTGENIMQMNAQSFAAGIYYIKVIDQTTGEEATTKFTK